MPIRVPQIIAQQVPDTAGGPRIDPGTLGQYAAAPARALEKGLSPVAETLGKVAADYARVQDALTKQEMKLDIDDKLTKVKDRLDQEAVGLWQEGVDPDQLPEEMRQRGTRVIGDVARDLRYPQSAVAFQNEANKLLGVEVIKQRHRGVDLKFARISVLTATQNDEDVNVAVNAPTTQEREAALARIQNRIGENLTTGIWSKEKAESELAKALVGVEEGKALRDFQDPRQASQVISALRRGQWGRYLSPQRQAQLADHLEAKERADEERRKKEQADAEKEVAAEAEKGITDAVYAKQYGLARQFLSSSRRFLTATRYEHWQEAIAKREAGVGVVSDPETKKRLQLAVYSIGTNPRLVAAQVDQAYRDGLLDDGDHKTYAAHLESRAQRATDQRTTELGREHAQAEQFITEWTRVPGGEFSMFLSGQAQNLKSMALEDLTRNSAYFGRGNEAPLTWAGRRKAFYIAQLQSMANQRLTDLHRQLTLAEQAVGAPLKSKEALERARIRFRSEADYFDAVRLLKEATEIRAYQNQLMPPRPGGGQGTTPTESSANPLGRR